MFIPVGVNLRTLDHAPGMAAMTGFAPPARNDIVHGFAAYFVVSIEPAIAALMGFAILAQRLGYRDIGAIAAIVVAAAGASWISSAGDGDGWGRRFRLGRSRRLTGGVGEHVEAGQ